MFVDDEKRNLGSLKNSPVHGAPSAATKQQKREVSYSIMDETNPELAESNYQTEYDELAQVMDEIYKMPEEKRYLGKQMPLLTIPKGVFEIFLTFYLSIYISHS